MEARILVVVQYYYGVILHMFSGPVTDSNKIDIMHGTVFLVPVLDSVTTISGDTSESY